MIFGGNRALLTLTPDDLIRRLPEIQKRLVSVAAHHGHQGDLFWALWMATMASDDDRNAVVRRLTGEEGYWCAAWCFEHDNRTLGLMAHERYLSTTVDEFPPNPYKDMVYAMEALRLDASARAFASLSDAKTVSGLMQSDEILLVTLGASCGAVPTATLSQIVTRFARTEDTLTRLAIAVGRDVLGDRAGAEACLGFLHRDTPLAPSILRVLTERFGDYMATAIAREPPPMAARARLKPGLMAVAGKRPTLHEFAPKTASGIMCPGCKRSMRTWWRLDLSALSLLPEGVRGLGRVQFPACFDCDYWMLTHEYSIQDEGSLKLLNVDGERRGLAGILGDYSRRAIATQPVRFAKGRAKLHEMPLDGDCQLGGDAAWIQDAMEPHCLQCSAAMTFVFRFSSPNGFNGCPEVAGGGGSGALYYHACGRCRHLRCAAQWT